MIHNHNYVNLKKGKHENSWFGWPKGMFNRVLKIQN